MQEPSRLRAFALPGQWVVGNVLTFSLDPSLRWEVDEYVEGLGVGARVRAFSRRSDPQWPDVMVGYALVVDGTGDPTERDVDALDERELRCFVSVLDAAVGEDGAIRGSRHFILPLMDGSRALVSTYLQERDGVVFGIQMRRFTQAGRRWVLMLETVAADDESRELLADVFRGILINKSGFRVPLPRPVPKTTAEEPARDVLTRAFNLAPEALPIAGGWGYERKDACVIVGSQLSTADPLQGSAVTVERLFVEKRIYWDLIVTHDDGASLAGIRWNLLSQEHVVHDGRRLDRLVVEITCMPEADWERLKLEWEGPRGFGHPDFDLARHEAERAAFMLRFEQEFWFDVTSTFG